MRRPGAGAFFRAALLLGAVGAAGLASPCIAPPGEASGPLAHAAPSPSARAAAPAASGARLAAPATPGAHAAPAASSAAAVPAPTRVSFRGRVVAVGGKPPEPAREFTFDWQTTAGQAVKTHGDAFSPWSTMGPREVEAFETLNRGRAERGIPMRMLLRLRGPMTEPTRVEIELAHEGAPAPARLAFDLFGPRMAPLLVREGAGWRATSSAAYNRRYWAAFAGAALPEHERPKRFIVADRLVDAGDDLTSYREGLAALRSIGVNTFGVPAAAALRASGALDGARVQLGVYAPPGYAFDYAGKASPPELKTWAEGQFKPYRDAGFSPDDVALFALSDEPGWYYPATLDDLAANPGGLARFRAYLRGKGLSPGELGAARWADVGPLGRSGAIDSKGARRHYWTARFLSRDSARHFSEATRAIEGAVRPGLPVFTNWNFFAGRLITPGKGGNNQRREHPDAAIAGHDWFDFARQRGGTMLWTEGWFGDDRAFLWPFYLGKLASAANQGGLATGAYLVPRARGKRGLEGFEQQALALVGSGAKAIGLFVFGPEYQFPGNGWSESPERAEHIASALRLVARAEDVLWPGKRPPAEVAIVVPRSAYVWDEVGVADAVNTNPNLVHPEYSAEVADLFFAFAHANVPVDFVDEDDLSAAGLARFKAVYLTEPDVPEEGLKALGAWARAGGTLVTVLDAGTGDRYGRPTTALSSLTGVEQGRAPGRVLLTAKGPAPGGRVRGAGPEGPVLGSKGHLRRHKGEALAWFDDGAPAIVRRAIGRGRHVHFDFFPGLSYYFSSREKRAELPVAFSEALRRWVVDPALEAGAKPPVRADVELVEGSLLLSPEGAALTLLNWTGDALGELALHVTLPFAPRSVRSARLGPLPFEVEPGGVALRLALGGSDVLAIKP